MPHEADTRQARERAFHDLAYASGAYDARSPNRFYPVTASLRALYEERVCQLASRGARALEYGCGTGSYAFTLADSGANVTGIDISDVAIEWARNEAERRNLAASTEFIAMDAESLEFPDAAFDLIYGSGILHHTDLLRSYSEIARTLKPGGTAVFSEPLGHNRLINLYRARTPEYRTEDEHPLLISDLELAGRYFARVRVRFFVLTSLVLYPLAKLPGFRPLLAGFDRIDAALFRRFEAARRNAWMVLLQLSEPRASS